MASERKRDSQTLVTAGLQSDRPFLVSPSAAAAACPAIGPVPRSGLLGRLSAFLPEMERANTTLADAVAAQGTQAFDIEHVEAEAQGHIEFDLACGVVDLGDANAERAAAAAVAGATTVDEDLRRLCESPALGALRGLTGLKGMATAAVDDSSSSDDDSEGGDVHIREAGRVEEAGVGAKGSAAKGKRKLIEELGGGQGQAGDMLTE